MDATSRGVRMRLAGASGIIGFWRELRAWNEAPRDGVRARRAASHAGMPAFGQVGMRARRDAFGQIANSVRGVFARRACARYALA
ncbi:hypothetical protein [Panacagrimonas perspica]|uniref:hypothetical protein n=1 Tax=Panacagrimonas perspica TaxID=381431 RepID=UPI001B38DC1E|nr:hypothetical protein [Panacagrimonas perspica]